MRNQKGITLIAIIIIIAIIILCIIIFSNTKPGYELNIANKECLALSELRLAIAKAHLNGSGFITTDEFNTLGKIVKNADSNNEWFSSNQGILYGDTYDTSDQDVTVISDGIYVATFTTKEKSTGPSLGDIETYLIEYTFEQKSFKGYQFYVTDDFEKDSSYYTT